MKKTVIILSLFMACLCHGQSNEAKDKKAIQAVLKKQRIAWSKGNLEGYMKGYWKSDSLKFYGRNGITTGWESTFEKYESGYPTKKDMGILSFKINDISKICEDSYYVMGEFHLKRDAGNNTGIFMIIFKKINGEWKIIADTSC